MVITQPTGYDYVTDNPEGTNTTFDFSKPPEVIDESERHPRKLTGVARNLMPASHGLEEAPVHDPERAAQLAHLIRGNGDMVCSARTATLADVPSFRLPT